MKIVNHKEFLNELKQNKKFIYSELHDYDIDGLFEGFEYSGTEDFLYNDLLGSVDNSDGKELWDIINSAKENKDPFKLDLDYTGRDGLFDDSRFYVIYDKEDVKKLVDKLNQYL